MAHIRKLLDFQGVFVFFEHFNKFLYSCGTSLYGGSRSNPRTGNTLLFCQTGCPLPARNAESESVFHMVTLEVHKGGIVVGFGIAVSIISANGNFLGVFFQLFTAILDFFAESLQRRFVLTLAMHEIRLCHAHSIQKGCENIFHIFDCVFLTNEIHW